MDEVWLPVHGYELLYEVSSHGRVRSLDRITFGRAGSTRVTRGRVRAQCPDPRGYLYVMLSAGGVKKRFAVHRLVATAFYGPCPDGMECCHNDGVSSNNHVDNLRWDTKVANEIDRRRHGKTTNNRILTTHCKYGHELTGSNVEYRSDSITGIRCKECRRNSCRKYYWESKGK